MTRRSTPFALGCGVLSALVPGLGQAVQRRWSAAALFAVPTVLAGLFFVWAFNASQGELLTWAVDTDRLQRVFWLAFVWAGVCAVAAADAVIAAWPRRVPDGARLGGAVAFLTVVLVATLPGVAAGWAAWRQESAIETVFTGPVGAEPEVAVPTEHDSETPITVGLEPWKPGDSARWNIALLGGDAGPGRPGLRTDTMIVVSMDPDSGDTVMVSVPRNLERLPMPAGPLRKKFPNGFDDLANAFYPYVSANPKLVGGGDGERAAASALKGALAQLLGIPIHHYVLVDMAGFVDIIDAMGGVVVNVPVQVPSPGNPPGAKHRVPPTIGPGVVKMDGTIALAYARSRTGDSDYNRMQRQRCLLASAAKSLSPADLVRRYASLVGAVEGAVSSDLPPERLSDLAKLFGKVDIDGARTLALTPPTIKVERPDVQKIRDLVQLTLAAQGTAPPTTEAPAAPTKGGNTTSTAIGTSGASTVGASC